MSAVTLPRLKCLEQPIEPPPPPLRREQVISKASKPEQPPPKGAAMQKLNGHDGRDPLAPLVESMRKLLRAEYDRGAREATQRIIAAAQGAGPATPRLNPKAGATRALIDQELARLGPATVAQVVEAASGRLTRNAVDLCLKRGRKGGRYRCDAGRWALQPET